MSKNVLTRAKKSKALAHFHAGRLPEARALLKQVCQADRGDAEAWQLLGAVRGMLGDYAEAESSLRQALRLHASPGSHYYLGNALMAQNRLEEAIAAFQAALRLQPQMAEAHANLGDALQNQGRYVEAEACYRRAIGLRPDLVGTQINLGLVLLRQKRPQEAAAGYERILRTHPGRPEVHYHRGNAYAELLRLDEAIASYREAIRLKPEFALAHNNLGIALHALGRYEEAVGRYREALRFGPAHAETHTNLGMALYDQGHTEQAAEHYRTALRLAPNDGTRIKLAIMLPPILRTHRHIEEVRTGLEKNLDALAATPLTLGEPDKEIVYTNFFLAYHGLNNRDLQVKIARLYEAACPELLWTAPHCREKKPRNGPIKIGFISKFMRDHSIGKTTSGLLAELSRDKFRVYALFVPPPVDDEVSRFIRAKADEIHVLPPSLAAARRQIADLELDILFYPDIGMEPFSYFLAFARLAPVQCVTFGHPDTTGIRNMDYWVSNDLFEPEDAQAHYSEQLFLLHNLGTLAYYYRPPVPAVLEGRARFGLPEDMHVYLCPQMLFKFHPDFDALLAGILRADPNGRIVLIEAKFPYWVELLRQRFGQSFPDMLDRIIFVPQQTSRDFINLLAVADVILDTPHFNGMNTSLEAFAVGTPVVTWPGALQRGRHTYAMYRKMDMNECIAGNAEEYVRIAVRLATDPAFRQSVRDLILARNHLLYEDMTAVREFERFFLEATARVPAN